MAYQQMFVIQGQTLLQGDLEVDGTWKQRVFLFEVKEKEILMDDIVEIFSFIMGRW